MSENPSQLGRQEPRGCRFIYGHPGEGDWHYCQRHLAVAARAGDPAHPPYCAHHTKVALKPETEAARRSRARFLERMANAVGGPPGNNALAVGSWMVERLAIDTLFKAQEHGVFLHD
jgi:hypothetical protein